MNTTKPQQANMTATEWQTVFTESIFDGLKPSLSSTFSIKDEQEQEQRFSIYQNNIFYSLSQALADLYPVIKKLVGDDFFNGTALAYIRQHPPQKAAMVYFGEYFPEFLSEFEHTQTMRYLADIAQLELARHKAYHASDSEALAPQYFEKIDPNTFEHSSVILHSSVHIINSGFPIFEIWQANQNDGIISEEISLNRSESVIIARQDYECHVINIDEGTYYFYNGLSNNMTIAEAAHYAYKSAKVDISAAIALGIQNGFFSELICSVE